MYDLIIIGGGPAGTAAAIAAARAQLRVLLLERGRFPRHKVCGEFVSAEALGLLSSLMRGCPEGEAVLSGALRVNCARLFADGSEARVSISPSAASIPRFQLDAALWRSAQVAGCDCRQQVEVLACQPPGAATPSEAAPFEVTTNSGIFRARSVVDASGRWSRLRNMPTSEPQRFRKQPDWLGLKAHYKTGATDAHEQTTDLYFFEGGYCGVQPVGEGELNVCAMTRSTVATDLTDVFALQPLLRERSRGLTQLTEAVATSPLIFREPTPERDGILCVGDAAGFIDPFAGDGISLALRSGTAAATALADFCHGVITLKQAVRRYRETYELSFAPAFRAAARLRRLLAMPRFARGLVLQLLQTRAFAQYVLRTTR
ncbi:MAG: NAD(P)/FAD-dependent oxidoreductase [Terriglobales bacterium]